jgi:hypothetical protein
MSAATVDRALKPLREQTKARRGISTTKAGTLLKRQIAIRTFADWSDARPGFLEMDLVAHCGWSGAGPFLYTLSMVDVATGWVACAGLRDKRQETVFHALQRLQADLPFRILGLDSDNGTEFINHVVLDYCTSQGITFTRSRPYLKNDTCHIEQKNWAVVRRLVGYDRLELPALPALERIHGRPWRLAVPKSESGKRLVPLIGPTAEALRAQRTLALEMRLAVGAAWQDLDFVFPTANWHAWRSKQRLPPVQEAAPPGRTTRLLPRPRSAALDSDLSAGGGSA